jgi:hypothetical protein
MLTPIWPITHDMPMSLSAHIHNRIHISVKVENVQIGFSMEVGKTLRYHITPADS